jgi:hypothetical protein
LTVTDAVRSTAGEMVSTTVDPETLTADGVMATPSTITEKRLAAAVVADNASENVNVTVVPAAFVAADTNAGPVVSTWLETLVADKLAALFPAESFTAFADPGCV